jgi:hypothetical protein
MASPFGCNHGAGKFSPNGKGKDKLTPEPVEATAHTNQVISLVIPFNTKQAPKIRETMHSEILHDNAKIFIFRQVNGWTNISLDSTQSVPKLTADPYTTLKAAWRVFNACPNVSTFTMKREDNTVLEYDDIDSLVFEDLPNGETADDISVDGSSDLGVVKAMIESLDDKVQDISLKTAHLIDVFPRLSKLTDTVQAIDKKITALSAAIGAIGMVETVEVAAVDEDANVVYPPTPMRAPMHGSNNSDASGSNDMPATSGRSRKKSRASGSA